MTKLSLALAAVGLTVAQALELSGEFIQGGLLFGQLQSGQQAFYNNRLLPLDQHRRFIIGLGRDAKPKISVVISNVDGQQRQQDFAIAEREYDIQYIDGVARKHVSPDSEQVARSQREARQVRQARNILRAQNNFFDGFRWPVTGPITGVFGSQRVYNGKPRRPHYGVDIAGPVGKPVVAPAAGKIVLAEADLFFSGGTLIIDHGYGLSSTFLHLSKMLVSVGDQVEQGQEVAEIGATGRVTGAHLDWRMNWFDGERSVRIDPQLLVPAMR